MEPLKGAYGYGIGIAMKGADVQLCNDRSSGRWGRYGGRTCPTPLSESQAVRLAMSDVKESSDSRIWLGQRCLRAQVPSTFRRPEEGTERGAGTNSGRLSPRRCSTATLAAR